MNEQKDVDAVVRENPGANPRNQRSSSRVLRTSGGGGKRDVFEISMEKPRVVSASVSNPGSLMTP